jgi:Holin of 3TMs, for gene-transfer release
VIPLWDNAIALLKDALDRFVPDKTAAAQAKAALDQLREQQDAQEFLAGMEVVKAEAQGESWLQRNWRPLSACVFVVLVCARWFGLSAPNITDGEYMELWGVVKLCLGGYTIGRSAEKIAPQVLQTIATLKGKST